MSDDFKIGVFVMWIVAILILCVAGNPASASYLIAVGVAVMIVRSISRDIKDMTKDDKSKFYDEDDDPTPPASMSNTI